MRVIFNQWSTGLRSANRCEARSVAELPVGSHAVVHDIQENGAVGERLLEMGLTPGTALQVVRRGAFGGPILLRLRGYLLSVGRVQARQIIVATT
ncbi:MAG: FeoA family protein [Myxococcota bacterium]